MKKAHKVFVYIINHDINGYVGTSGKARSWTDALSAGEGDLQGAPILFEENIQGLIVEAEGEITTRHDGGKT